MRQEEDSLNFLIATSVTHPLLQGGRDAAGRHANPIMFMERRKPPVSFASFNFLPDLCLSLCGLGMHAHVCTL